MWTDSNRRGEKTASVVLLLLVRRASGFVQTP